MQPNDEVIERSPPTRASLWIRVRALCFILLLVAFFRSWFSPSDSATREQVLVPATPVPLDNLPIKGSRNAPVGLLVFSDFQCPACRTFAINVLPLATAEYVTAGTLLIAFSDLPLESIHPAAVRRAAIAECAGRQGHFWEVHDRLFAGQRLRSIDADSLEGLDPHAMQACLKGGADEVVRSRRLKASKLGVSSTPTTFIGQVRNGELSVAHVLVGVPRISRLRNSIDEAVNARASRILR